MGVGGLAALLPCMVELATIEHSVQADPLRGRLNFHVSLWRIRLPTAQVMLQSITVTHSQVLPLVFGRSAGLRLLAGSVFKAFLAVTVRPHSASSSVFHSIRRLAGVVFHPAANPAVKLTRQRRAAYFVR